MNFLEERIMKDGVVKPGNVLKVDSFLNHQMDIELFNEMGKEWKRRFADKKINKILTIEASGIGIACLTAQFFHCPVLFAKKAKTSNLSDKLWASKVHSYTHNTDHDVIVAKKFLGEGDRVLIIDDFLANGCALQGLISIDDFLANGSALNALLDLCRQAGATAVGAGIVIEKAYQSGGEVIRRRGIRVESLARIASMSVEDGIKFC